MKQTKFLFLLTALLSMVGARALASDISVANADGVTIYYIWANNKTELSVTYRGSTCNSYNNEYTGNVVIPESVTYNGKTYPVTSIGLEAFSGCSGLTSVTIPNSVTSIGSYAFRDCSGLTSVTIPNSVTSIGGLAFSGCANIKEPVYTSSVFACMPRSYQGEYVIPGSPKSIASGAFSGCSGLTSVTIPNSVTSIGYSAFEGCSNLESVTIGTGVLSIGSKIFDYI